MTFAMPPSALPSSPVSFRGRPDAHVQGRSTRLARRSEARTAGRTAARTTARGAAALACLVTAVGCGSQSLVPIDVVGDAPFSNVELRIFPSVGYPKTVAHASFSSTTPLQIGIYLPEKAAGTVQLTAEAVDGLCVVGKGAATATDVRAGVLSTTVTLHVAHVTGCEAPTGGTGAGGGAGGVPGIGAGGRTGAMNVQTFGGPEAGAPAARPASFVAMR